MSPPSLDPDAASVSRGAGNLGKAREAVEGRLQAGGDAYLVHYTAQNPFQDIVLQRGQGSEGRASQGVFSSVAAQGCHTRAQQLGYVLEHHAEARAVAEAGPDFSTLELKSRDEGEGVQPSRGGTAGAA
jgi:hypothetical protein